MNVSKYFTAKGEKAIPVSPSDLGLTESKDIQEVQLPEIKLPKIKASSSSKVRIKKKRAPRAKREFAIYTYRGNRFIFGYQGDNALVYWINPSTNTPELKVTVPLKKAQLAARTLARIVTAEARLDSLSR